MSFSLRSIVFVLALLCSISACNKKEVGPQRCEDNNFTGIEVANFVLVGCEGYFGSPITTSLSLYDPFNMQSFDGVYYEENNESPGNVLQSIYEIENSIFLIMNNSEVIVEIDKTSLSLLNTIHLQNRSPRFMIDGGNGQSFISNFVLNPNGEPVYIDVMDNASRSIVDSINVGVWAEEMVVRDELLYACGMRGNKVIVIDVNSHEIVDEIDVGVEATSIVKDINGDIWVLCTGGFSEEHPSLWKIGADEEEIESFVFNDINDYPTHLKINGAKDELYFLNNGVFNMPINAPELPEDFIIGGEMNFYGLGVDPNSNDIYYSIIDDDGLGKVYRYDLLYGMIDEFEVGILPSSFLFVD